jgi:SAM-dependent methyltransferase
LAVLGLIGVGGSLPPALVAGSAAGAASASSPYVAGRTTPDGIGKYLLGREIAHFMSHLGAPWLERPEREQEERPSEVIEALELKPGDLVADIGCGTGYFSWRMARAVGPTGKVYGVEIQEEMLTLLRAAMAERGVSNVFGVQGTPEDPRLPEPVDLAILVDVYHECSHPVEMVAAIVRSLKPGGRLVLVEYRGEDPRVPIKPLHKMTERQILREMALHPLEHVRTYRGLPWQHLVVFRKPASG